MRRRHIKLLSYPKKDVEGYCSGCDNECSACYNSTGPQCPTTGCRDYKGTSGCEANDCLHHVSG